MPTIICGLFLTVNEKSNVFPNNLITRQGSKMLFSLIPKLASQSPYTAYLPPFLRDPLLPIIQMGLKIKIYIIECPINYGPNQVLVKYW